MPRKTKFSSLNIIFLLLTLIALCLRLYQFNNLFPFTNDQGEDLLVTSRIVNEKHFQLVGPYLSVPDFYIPPTYYYLLAFFLAITRSVEGVIFCFLLLNIASMLLLAYLASLLFGRLAVFITIGLFSISYVMILHATRIWQPEPIFFFLVLSLGFLLKALREKKKALLFISIFLYIIALSIYPSPLLLLPYYLVQIRIFFGNYSKRTKIKHFCSTLIFASFSILIIYSPLIYFFHKNGLLPLKALFTSSFGLSGNAIETVKDFLSQPVLLLNDFTSLGYLFPKGSIFINSIYFVILIVVLLVVFYSRNSLPIFYQQKINSFFSFVQIRWLTFGLMFMLIFQEKDYVHRLWSYLPFYFLIHIFLVWLAMRLKKRQLIFPITILLFLYLGSNLIYLLKQISNPSRVTFGVSQKAALLVENDFRSRDLSSDDIGLIMNKIENYSDYSLTPIQYFLYNSINLPIPFSPSGNRILNDEQAVSNKLIIYLFCKGYLLSSKDDRLCMDDFVSKHSNYVLVNKNTVTEDIVLYIFKKENNIF